ncbi:hypothetical protein DFH09DRAFT_1329759 [Mycena vulgaris]|nr:hypothetical protein DFH09DRAFT_1329759 [Mycena vulgaris]
MSSLPIVPIGPFTDLTALATQLQTIAQAATAIGPNTDVAALMQTIARAAIEAQARLITILAATSFVPVPSFTAGTPATPTALAAATPVDAEVENYWVVLRGREPGLYLTVHAANTQTNGVPGQFQQRKNGRAEALAFYAANYPDHVRKWIQVPAPVPVADAPLLTSEPAPIVA